MAIPVIVGIGEITDRPADPADGLEPRALMVEALLRADSDSGASLLSRLDSLDVVNQVSWPYADLPAQICALLGVHPARAVYGPIGGESPVRFLHEAAARIARGESEVAAVCGAEAQNTLDRARRAGVTLPWTARPETFEPPLRGIDFLHEAAVNLGVFLPVSVYPFYENATASAWAMSPEAARAESGRIWSAMSAVAAENPYAWLRERKSAADIVTPSAGNRPIAHPYTKLTVANPSVNQGGAVLLTSLERARAVGIPESRCIFVGGGAAANEPRDYLLRDTYDHAAAQDVVLEFVTQMVDSFDAVELYSCFPCVPKMARRTLGLSEDVVPTVAGGLTFFGAPLNTYMTHAACAMVRRLREGGGVGLLYGQGEFVTKHHALVVSTGGSAGDAEAPATVQAEADARRGAVPAFDPAAEGEARVESFTVIYDRDGAATHGVVIARLESGVRTLGRVPSEDEGAIARLIDAAVSPVGDRGRVRSGVFAFG